MSFVSRAFWFLSVSATVLVLLGLPLTANAQNGITSIPDLNGDGRSDLLWYNPTTGQTVAWLMDGTTVSSSALLLSDPSWKIIKTADFNGDGMTDLLWYSPTTGQTAASLMNGTSVSSWTTLLTDGEWKVIEAADFNGDHKTDLLWYNASTGQTAAWIMNGTTATSWTVLLTDGTWKVTATADLNGDGKADLLWYNASLGQTAAWLMNGTNVISWAVLYTDPNWKVVGTADLNGDSMADLLWYNASLGQNAAWLMSGTNTTAWLNFPANPDLKIVAAADLNGDTKADLIWRNSLTGQTSVWLMNGLSATASASLLVDPNWTVAATGDLNSDRNSDLLWYNTTTGQTSAWLMNGTRATNGMNLFADAMWRLRCIKPTSLTPAMACDDSVFNSANGTMPFNQAPSVNAGADQAITLPAGANLFGNVRDDGAPIALLLATWAQVSGPGSVTFGNANDIRTTATFSAAGTYILRLTVSDTAFATSDEVVITVNPIGTIPAGSNTAPAVNAGPDQAVTLPGLAIMLGAATDDGRPTGSVLANTWSKASGPGTVTFANASALTTTASFTVAGTYVLRLTAFDGLLTSADDVTIVVTSTTTNHAPVVSAGPDQMITFPSSATLAGNTYDDGLPAGGVVTKTWTKISGTGTVTFGNASALNSTVTFSVAGTYTLRLTVSDSVLTSADDVVIVVSPPTVKNLPPVVNAGVDKTIALPSGATLSGTASDDGLPTGSSLSVSWSKFNGPGTVVLVNSNSLNATATFSSIGTYTLRLTATDGAMSSTDDVVVVVNPTPGNQAPVVNAGPDFWITLPAGITLAGTATDDGLPTGSALTKTWSKVSGPGTVTFSNASAPNSGATFSVAGTYTLRLTVSDSQLSSSDDVVFVVYPVGTTNVAPVVNAGPDYAFTLPSGITLAGTATDDGLPGGSTLTKLWSKVIGPGTVTFSNASSVNSSATFSAAGTYTLRLTASDSLLSSSDDVVFVVNAGAAIAGGKDLYFAQTATGSGSGADCSNALAISYLNNFANWGSGATQIGPGTTAHLCGTLTTPIQFYGSGTAGSPIIVKFETGAKFSAPTWTTAVIAGSAKSYIEVDGGTNGLIEFTNNGSSPTYAYQNDQAGVSFPQCSHCRVHHLTVSNSYVKNTRDSQGGGNGIFLLDSSDSRVDHNTIHDAKVCIGWTINVNVANIEIDHNVLYHCNWGTLIGGVQNTTATNILWHDNDISDWQNWDDLVNNSYHHNGLHVFLQAVPTTLLTGLQIYNNYFHGDPGATMTGNIYLESRDGVGTIASPLIYNNVFSMNTNNPSNGELAMGSNGVTSPSVYNNVFSFATNTGGTCVGSNTPNLTMKNNIFRNCGHAVYSSSGNFLASDYNDYYGNTYLGPWAGGNPTLAQWQSISGMDTHSIAGNPTLDAAFKPQAGSPVIGAGTNLSDLLIVPLDSDKNAVARPSVGAWSIGASQ